MPSDTRVTLKSAFLELAGRRLHENPCCYFVGFGITRHGLALSEASNRLIEMPIAEETILGMAVGMARVGAEVFVDLMFEAFVYRTMDVLINQAAISSLLPAQSRGPIIIRVLCGPFPGAGPQHGATGYALLSRIPHLLVASPCTAADVEAAHDVALRKGALLLILSAPDGSDSEIVLGEALERIHVCGRGRRLGIVCWGLHVSLVAEAVRVAGAWAETRILTPLFLAPLPLDGLLREVAEVEELLIIDGPPPPMTLGEVLAAAARLRGGCRRISQRSLWVESVGADYDPQSAVRDLARVILESMARRPEGHA